MSDSPSKSKNMNNVVRRDDKFTEKVATKIWHETPSESNPYCVTEARCHGYNLIDLLKNRSYVDVVFLLFRGELPNKAESALLERLMISFINPGPRHAATRAAMTAGVGNTDSAHILPIGLTVLGGEYLGAAEVEKSMRWIRRSSRRDAVVVAQEVLQSDANRLEENHVAPGFGSRFCDIEELTDNIAKEFSCLDGTGKIFKWCNHFVTELNKHGNGWLSTGLVASILCDLGFQPRMGTGMFQLISAPGIFAHGIEMANKPITAMPFPDDKDYSIESSCDKTHQELDVMDE